MKYFPISVNIFPMPKILNYFFDITSLSGICWQHNQQKYMVYNLLYQLVVDMWKYLPQREKVCETNECHKVRVIFCRPFPLSGKHFTMWTTSSWKKICSVPVLERPGSVYTSYSEEHSLSFSARFCKSKSNTNSDWLNRMAYKNLINSERLMNTDSGSIHFF